MDTAFQFLMVRLKAASRYICSAVERISIPYGAIKRLYSFIRSSLLYTFQFLMVRLKAGEVPEPIKLKKFQFLMVRLKV
mgnify:CR=1 FL=1